MVDEFLDEKERKILELDVRRKIYALVVDSPGCHFREIVRKSALSIGSAVYHLHYLAKKGLVLEEKRGNNVRYFPRSFALENEKVMSLLRQENLRKILLFVLMHKGCYREKIVEYMNLSPSAVSWHLKKLEDEKIIGFAQSGRKTVCVLLITKEKIMELLIMYRTSFLDALVDRVVEMWEIN